MNSYVTSPSTTSYAQTGYVSLTGAHPLEPTGYVSGARTSLEVGSYTQCDRQVAPDQVLLAA